MSEHSIREDRQYIPTSGGDKDSDIPIGYHCVICGAKGASKEEINKSPCKPCNGGK